MAHKRPVRRRASEAQRRRGVQSKTTEMDELRRQHDPRKKDRKTRKQRDKTARGTRLNPRSPKKITRKAPGAAAYRKMLSDRGARAPEVAATPGAQLGGGQTADMATMRSSRYAKGLKKRYRVHTEKG